MIARDAGGNERHALFSIDATGGSELPLSDDPEAIHVPGAFSPDGTLLAFTHTGRNGVDFDVAVVAVGGGGRRELAQPGGWSHVVDWSEHGILVQRANTPFDHDLFLVDPESGALTPLTPHDGEVAYDSARLLPDGAVLCACDAGSEFARLAVLRHGAEPRVPDAPTTPTSRSSRSTRRGRSARGSINRGGESEVWLDGRRLEGLPGGVVSALAFAPDGSLTSRPARPTTRPTSGRPRPRSRRRTRSAVGGLDRSGFVRPVLEEVESFDGRRIPYLRFGAGGAPRAVLGARRAGVAVPAADGARDPVPLRAGHHRRGAQRARLDRLRAHLPPPRRRRAAARLGRRPGGAGAGARGRRRARPSASWAAPTAAT